MKLTVKRLSLVVLAIIVMSTGFILSGCKHENGTTLVKLNEVTHSVFYAPLYAGINKGFFKEEGIDIELTNGGGTDKTMTAVISGQADIGLMGPEAAVYVYNEGKEDYCVIVGQVTKRDGSFIVGRTNEPDFKWSSFKDKSIIGGRKGGMPLMTLEYVLKQNGLMPGQDVDVMTNVQFNLMAGAFEGGTGDYVALFEPTATEIELAGKGYVISSIGQESGEVPYTGFGVKKSYLESNYETVEKFIRAFYKSQKWVQEQPSDVVAEALLESFPSTSKEVLTKVVERYREIDAWMTQPQMTRESFDRLQEIMTEAGELNKKVPYEELIDNSIADKITSE